MAKAEPMEKGEHQNIGRATLVLAALADASTHGLRLTDVIRATGLGKATTHRILAGLVAHGLAEQDKDSGYFFVGLKMLDWATAAGDRFGLAHCAAPLMARLAEQTADTAYLSLRSNDEAVCIGRYEGSFPIRTLTLGLGDRRPLGIGAGSLALLAFLPDEEVVRILDAQRDARASYDIDEFELRGMVGRAKKQGFALNDERVIPGMSAIGVPVRRPDGFPVAAVSIAAISKRLEQPRLDTLVSTLRDTAVAIENELAPVLRATPVRAGVRSATG